MSVILLSPEVDAIVVDWTRELFESESLSGNDEYRPEKGEPCLFRKVKKVVEKQEVHHSQSFFSLTRVLERKDVEVLKNTLCIAIPHIPEGDIIDKLENEVYPVGVLRKVGATLTFLEELSSKIKTFMTKKEDRTILEMGHTVKPLLQDNYHHVKVLISQEKRLYKLLSNNIRGVKFFNSFNEKLNPSDSIPSF